uniref:Uncharacterized protein n=1 Tax=Molossus molossus TaxID=27622 RepID=A0A7J8CS16_MOLMO|nr:hypothetical protein HJG59_009754 [Molossus molossus]
MLPSVRPPRPPASASVLVLPPRILLHRSTPRRDPLYNRGGDQCLSKSSSLPNETQFLKLSCTAYSQKTILSHSSRRHSALTPAGRSTRIRPSVCREMASSAAHPIALYLAFHLLIQHIL